MIAPVPLAPAADALTIFAAAEIRAVALSGRSPAPAVPGCDGTEEERGLAVYRDRTMALLRRYLRVSVELGRLPSLVGREFFRSRVTSYRVHTFEDSVIFAHDVERCLEMLDAFSQKLIARIVLEEYTQDEAAMLLRCTRQTVSKRFPQALDELSDIFLRRRLLRGLPSPTTAEACQEAKFVSFPATQSNKTK